MKNMDGRVIRNRNRILPIQPSPEHGRKAASSPMQKRNIKTIIKVSTNPRMLSLVKTTLMMIYHSVMHMAMVMPVKSK